MKRCSKCGCVKDITEFYRDRTTKDGYHSRCKACISECYKEYYKENKEKFRRCERVYRQTPKGKIATARRDKKYQHSEKGKATAARGDKKYYQTLKGKMAIKRAVHRRRARMKNTEVTLTLEQWDLIIRIQGNMCNICKRKFTKKRFPTMDHIIPLSKGGGLTFENVQALCKSCNSSKHAKLDPGFIQTWLHK